LLSFPSEKVKERESADSPEPLKRRRMEGRRRARSSADEQKQTPPMDDPLLEDSRRSSPSLRAAVLSQLDTRR
jgi:hypothetical protein